MALLEKLMERSARAGARPDLTVETFEYVRVGPAALVRAAGSWTAPGLDRGEITVRVRTADGRHHALTALAEPDSSSRRSWKAAFPATAELVRDPAAEFSLDAAGRSIDLPRPVRRALRADEQLEVDDGEFESAREQALESRVREAEAGLRWMEEQLRHERKRRRLFEQERASLEKRNETLREELQELSAHAIELSGLSR